MSNSKLRTASARGAWILALTALLVSAPTASSQAASVTWGTPIGISTVGDSIVSTDGELVTAINFDTNAQDRTVNGVTFEGETSPPPGWEGRLYDPNNVYTDGNVGPQFRRLLNSFTFGSEDPTSSTASLTLSGLTAGTPYQVQFFVSDDRGVAAGRTQFFTGGANDSSTELQSSSYSLIGTFVADGISQLISVTGLPGEDSSARPIVNVYQVRNIVPEPSTALLAAIGIVGLLAFARRKKHRAGV